MSTRIDHPLTVLRRGSILFTMIAEYFVLGVKAEVRVQLSVYLMIFGAAMAASNDLSFHLGRRCRQNLEKTPTDNA